jgi:hypothetical protein
MAVKEASQRQIIEQQFIQIADLQKANHRLREELADGVSSSRVWSSGMLTCLVSWFGESARGT